MRRDAVYLCKTPLIFCVEYFLQKYSANEYVVHYPRGEDHFHVLRLTFFVNFWYFYSPLYDLEGKEFKMNLENFNTLIL